MSKAISPRRREGAEFQHVQIGDVRLARLENGRLWMTHRNGEGMEISDETKLAKLVEKFFWREF